MTYQRIFYVKKLQSGRIKIFDTSTQKSVFLPNPENYPYYLYAENYLHNRGIEIDRYGYDHVTGIYIFTSFNFIDSIK